MQNELTMRNYGRVNWSVRNYEIFRFKAWIGDKNCNFLRGFRLILCWIFKISSSLKSSKLAPLGMYCRISPLIFSTAPFCHEAYGSAKKLGNFDVRYNAVRLVYSEGE